MADCKTLKQGDKVCLKIIDHGEVSYAGPDEVTESRGNQLFLKNHDRYSLRRQGMAWDERQQSWKFSNPLSTYSVTICPVEDERMYSKTKQKSLQSGELTTTREARALLAFIDEARVALPSPPQPKRRHKASRHASPMLAH